MNNEKCTENNCVHSEGMEDKNMKWSELLSDIVKVVEKHNIDGNFHLRVDQGLFIAMVVMK